MKTIYYQNDNEIKLTLNPKGIYSWTVKLRFKNRSDAKIISDQLLGIDKILKDTFPFHAQSQKGKLKTVNF